MSATFQPGYHRVRDIVPVGSPPSTRVLWIAPLPEDAEWPMPRPWLGAWLTEADARFASLAVIRGEPELITSMIIERIETAVAS
ncbi:hypothetical protein ACFPOB_15850 [Bosea eneae]|uniref:Uncharacterized protein n=1 Tax=Bosea eneae TaxID=151454 RepID=A0ABW0ITN6_9HYPH